jgi:hypothetical protein
VDAAVVGTAAGTTTTWRFDAPLAEGAHEVVVDLVAFAGSGATGWM